MKTQQERYEDAVDRNLRAAKRNSEKYGGLSVNEIKTKIGIQHRDKRFDEEIEVWSRAQRRPEPQLEEEVVEHERGGRHRNKDVKGKNDKNKRKKIKG